MPVPSPKPNESQQSFVSRCIRQLHHSDPNRDDKQIQAICYSKWRDKKKQEPPKRDGKPRSDAERAMNHFNISPEKWRTMSSKERQSYISRLPERGQKIRVKVTFNELD